MSRLLRQAFTVGLLLIAVEPDRFAQKTLMKRQGTSEEIARGVVLLASDDASFITALEINIDGGQGQR